MAIWQRLIQVYERVRRRFERNEKFENVLQSIIDWNDETPIIQLEEESISPILAGSDTVAAFVHAAALHLTQTPVVWETLRHRIDTATATGKLSNSAQYNETKDHVLNTQLIVEEKVWILPNIGTSSPRRPKRKFVRYRKATSKIES